MSTLQGTGVTGISNYIKTNILGMCSTLNSSSIFDYEPTSLAGFPAVTLTFDGFDTKISDNTRNERTYKFLMALFVDRSPLTYGAETAESIFRSMVDEVVLKFDDDPTLGGNCINSLLTIGESGYTNRENNNLRMITMTLTCTDVSKWR